MSHTMSKAFRTDEMDPRTFVLALSTLCGARAFYLLRLLVDIKQRRAEKLPRI